MKNFNLPEQIVELRIMLQGICDGFSTENFNKKTTLTMRVKVLYMLSKNKNCPPSVLIEGLGIAKSNLALLCKAMCEEGVICASKSETDKRNVYYSLTAKGERELKEFYGLMLSEFDLSLTERETKIIEKKFEEIIDFLNKKYKGKKND